jgi:hypothetical protein
MRKVLVGAAVAALFVAGCGDDEESSSTDEYCRLVTELDEAGNEAFSSLDDDSSDEDFAAAFSEFFDENREDIERLEEVAPEEISEEVATLVEIQRQAGETGDLSELESEASAEADAAVQEFEDENCEGGADDDPEDRGEVEE